MMKIRYILITLLATILLPITAKAANDIESYYDVDNQQYLFYTDNITGNCEYALSPNSTKPIVFHTCEKDTYGNNVIIVDLANVSNNNYLWTQKDDLTPELAGIELSTYYTNALPSDVSDLIGKTTTRIKVTPGNRIITVTDNSLTNIKYMLVKVGDANYTSLLSRATNLQKLSATSNPFAAIQSMNAFNSSYTSLLPNKTDTNWLNLPADKIIHEPETTQTGDVYIVWLMGTKANGETEYDMQIMYCLREDETVPYQYTEEFTRKLPHTGLDTSLYVLLGANVIALPAVYLNKKRIAKKA